MYERARKEFEEMISNPTDQSRPGTRGCIERRENLEHRIRRFFEESPRLSKAEALKRAARMLRNPMYGGPDDATYGFAGMIISHGLATGLVVADPGPRGGAGWRLKQ